MDSLPDFLETLQKNNLTKGNFLGLLHMLIGRRICRADGSILSKGLTWRELSVLLKKVRWDVESARELRLDPGALPPRERERFWYAVIARANVDSEAAAQASEKFVKAVEKFGYHVGPAPGSKGS